MTLSAALPGPQIHGNYTQKPRDYWLCAISQKMETACELRQAGASCCLKAYKTLYIALKNTDNVLKQLALSRLFSATLVALVLTGCASAPAEVTNPVTWYAVNGWDDRVSFDVFDLVCERYLPDQRLGARREAQVTSCGDERGYAAIRYRREGLAPGSPWNSQSSVRSGSRVFMR